MTALAGSAVALNPNEGQAINVLDINSPVHWQMSLAMEHQGLAYVNITKSDGNTVTAGAAQIAEDVFILAGHELVNLDGTFNTLNSIGTDVDLSNPINIVNPLEIHIKDLDLILAGVTDRKNIGDIAVVFTDPDPSWAFPGMTLPLGPLISGSYPSFFGPGYLGDPNVGVLGYPEKILGGISRIVSGTYAGYSPLFYNAALMSDFSGRDGEAYAQPGDSGGGWFYEILDAQPGEPRFGLGGGDVIWNFGPSRCDWYDRN